MTNYQSGHDAEKLAADHLASLGFKTKELNWKTRYCEIDIVAEKSKTMYFVEVKARKTNTHGSGLEYITPKKLEQMSFAAELWVAEHNWPHDYQLAAIELSGIPPTITNFLTDL